MTRSVEIPEAKCVFCVRISRGEYDKEYPGFSFQPLNPVVAGHRLFVPGEHVSDASQDPSVTAKVFAAAAEYARRQGHDFNLITSRGHWATQSVGHLHVHYVPRFEGDGLTLPWTGQRKADRRELAALPYLAPAEPVDFRQAAEEANVRMGQPRGWALPAPAGDGGLREALEKIKQAKRRLWAGLMAVKPKLDEPYPDDARWTPWTRFVGPRLDDLWAAFDALLLAAHPAAPAVPQPVDREVGGEAGRIEGHPCTPGGAKLGRRKTRAETRDAVAICLHSFDGYAIEAGENWGECDEDRKGAYRYQADAVLAVLAGEQEQVEP